MRQYISSHGGFRFVMRNHYVGASGRGDLLDVLLGVYLDPVYFPKWPQSITFECREIRKRKGVSILVVHSLFVSHLIDQLVLMLSSSVDVCILVTL